MQDRVVMVTGASGGIGRAVAAELLAAGAEVILLGRSKARLQAAVPSHAGSHRVTLLEADLTEAAATETVRAVISKRGRLDALVLSSGIYERSEDVDTFHRQMASNVLGPYALVRIVLPMLLQNQGQIVFVNSSQAIRAAASVGQYAATMHAMKAIADSLRDEVNQRGVRVTTLYLGRTAGERQEKIFELEGRAYLPEALIQPADVGQTILYLLQTPKTAEVTDLMMRPMKKS
jgi:NADP-dependent 3-hydroxy acid dehydrogenase YdfG